MSRVLVIDDDPRVHAALRLRLGVEPDLQLVGDASTAAGGVELVRSARPDVVILDVDLPDQSGLDIISELHAAWSSARVVMLSVHDRPDLRERARSQGAAAYVGKHQPVEVLLAAVRDRRYRASNPR